MNHIDRCLQKASEYEKKGDKEKANYFYNLAERFEECFQKIKHIETKFKIDPKRK